MRGASSYLAESPRSQTGMTHGLQGPMADKRRM